MRKNVYFLSKTVKRNITIEFSIFEVVLGLNLILIKQFSHFGPNLPEKRVVLVQKNI